MKDGGALPPKIYLKTNGIKGRVKVPSNMIKKKIAWYIPHLN